MKRNMARYHVQDGGANHSWLVLDRLKNKLHNDVVATFTSRSSAREKAHELNLEAGYVQETKDNKEEKTSE